MDVVELVLEVELVVVDVAELLLEVEPVVVVVIELLLVDDVELRGKLLYV